MKGSIHFFPKWEHKLTEEIERLKKDLIRLHSEEKRVTVESLKIEKEKELSTAKEALERARQDLVKEVDSYAM
jgi:hypothetical protein